MKNKSIWVLFLTAVFLVGLAAGCSQGSATPLTVTVTQTPPAPVQPVTTPPPAIIATAPVANVSSTSPVVNLPSFADMLAATEHSVVKIDITATGTSLFGRPIQVQGAGSGWIFDPGGIIVTNDHVVDGAATITVTTLDGKSYPAQIIKTDPVSDLALLKIQATQLPAIQIGDASKIRVGDWVVAIGNPLGEGIIATQGIISRLKVDLPVSSTQNYNNLIETTAAINPGNSGGPLVNLSGQVIGITSAKVSSSGIEGMGYAINMVDALPIIRQLATP
jgi:serine protease Do